MAKMKLFILFSLVIAFAVAVPAPMNKAELIAALMERDAGDNGVDIIKGLQQLLGMNNNFNSNLEQSDTVGKNLFNALIS